MPDGAMPTRAVHPVLNLPNAITFARLCAVPVSVWLVLRQRFDLAFILFAASGLSDAVDGWLARRQGGTALGAISALLYNLSVKFTGGLLVGFTNN